MTALRASQSCTAVERNHLRFRYSRATIRVIICELRTGKLDRDTKRVQEGEMKRIYILIFVLFVTAFVRGDAGVTRAQDPLVVNSKSIALKLENSRVRVLEATLEPGVEEQLHSHAAYVIYGVACGHVRNQSVDGVVTETDFRTGDVIYRDPITHWAENIGNTAIRLEL